MIAGVGVDLVDIPRFERTIERTPRLLERLFSPGERALPPRSLAARYAAKEALIKALGGSDGVHWTEIEVTPEESGRPWFTLTGSTADIIAERGITAVHLSMSHDAGLAIAYVMTEIEGDAALRTAGVAEAGLGAAVVDFEQSGAAAGAAAAVINAAEPVAEATDPVAEAAAPLAPADGDRLAPAALDATATVAASVPSAPAPAAADGLIASSIRRRPTAEPSEGVDSRHPNPATNQATTEDAS